MKSIDTMNAIEVRNISKRYTIYHERPTFVKDFLIRPFNIRKDREEFWALRDVSFDVKKGETIGIIGENGAGKSTLLKILTGVTRPTSGSVKINGRVGALLELGAGFHPDLTGRENIYLNGSILGLSKKEIDRKFDEIVEFSGIKEFIDTPVRTYSSGMFVRLGFSVAVHIEPEILIIDEVLAVGDEEFQRKCISKINSLQENGTAIIFVSHALTTVKGISSKVIWMENGKVKKEGIPAEVIDAYLSLLGKTPQIEGKAGRRWGTREAEIIDIALFNSQNERISKVMSGEETTIVLSVRFNKEVKNPIFGIIVKNDREVVVYGINSRWRHMTLRTFERGEEIKVIFKQRMQLINGLYYVDPAIAYPDGITFCDWRERALEFIVDLPVQTIGIANLDSQISIINSRYETLQK